MHNHFFAAPHAGAAKHIVIAALLLAAVGAAIALRPASDAGKDAETKAETPLRFASHDIARVETRALPRRIPLSGTIDPIAFAQVKSKQPGQVLRVLVREGETVVRGQLLAELDASDLATRLAAARADLAEREARLALARTNQANSEALLARQYISRNALDQTQSAFQAAVAAVDWARSQVRLAQTALADARVLAPIGGIVAQRLVQGGDRVNSETVLLTVADLSTLELAASVPIADAPLLAPGQLVRFAVDGFSGREFTGKVERISPLAETGTRALKVFLHLPNPDGNLKGGMYAKGVIESATGQMQPVVPATAIGEEAGQRFVFTIENQALVRRPVTTGREDEASGLITLESGPPAGTPVVRVRMTTLKEGMKAEVTTQASAVTAPEKTS